MQLYSNQILAKATILFLQWAPRYVTMVKREFEVRQLQATDNHYMWFER